MDVASAQSLWDPVGVYLNTASVGLPPRPAFDRMSAILEDWRTGRTSWKPWGDATERARESFARMVGADVGDVAIGGNVSQFVGVIASALPDGAQVVVPELEFTSSLFPFMVHADRGVEVVTVPAEKLADAIEPSTTAVAFGLVQSATGDLVDVDAVCAAAREHDVLTIADTTQACGWLPVDATRFDYVVCAAYKWLMSPRGSGFMVVHPSRLDSLRPTAAGWYAGESVHDSYYGPPLRLASSARRFDLSPAWFSWIGTEGALNLIEDIGIDAIHAHDVGLANRFLTGLGLPPGDSAIVSVDAPDARDRLEAAGVQAALRDGRVRVSFHLYNTEADVDAALNALVG
jgi:selenocysteine lyase/cysteine desulfurase